MEDAGEHLATTVMTSLLRGDGGMGGSDGSPPPPHAIPNRERDAVVALETSIKQAAIYRLSGDENPLQIDPEVARAASLDACASVACQSISTSTTRTPTRPKASAAAKPFPSAPPVTTAVRPAMPKSIYLPILTLQPPVRAALQSYFARLRGMPSRRSATMLRRTSLVPA